MRYEEKYCRYIIDVFDFFCQGSNHSRTDARAGSGELTGNQEVWYCGAESRLHVIECGQRKFTAGIISRQDFLSE